MSRKPLESGPIERARLGYLHVLVMSRVSRQGIHHTLPDPATSGGSLDVRQLSRRRFSRRVTNTCKRLRPGVCVDGQGEAEMNLGVRVFCRRWLSCVVVVAVSGATLASVSQASAEGGDGPAGHSALTAKALRVDTLTDPVG